jgi:hypothetical protein
MNHGQIPTRGKTTIYLALEFIQAPVCWVRVGWDSSGVTKLTTRQGYECVELYFYPPYAFIVWCLIKARNDFTFAFNMRRRMVSFTLLWGVPWFSRLVAAFNPRAVLIKFVLDQVTLGQVVLAVP